MNRTLTSLLAAATLAVSSLAFSTSASALTITMDSEPLSCPTGGGDPLSIGDGFVVTGLAGNAGICDGSLFPTGLAAGDNVLFVDTGFSFTLEHSGGLTFSLDGFDVITQTGDLAVSTANLSGLATLGSMNTIGSGSLTDVADVTSVTFSSNAGAIFNNFVVSFPAGANVSEPGSIAMMGLGLGLLGLRLRRRKSVNA